MSEKPDLPEIEPEKKQKMVELSKLNLAMDNKGRIYVGEIEDDLKGLKKETVKDITGPFFMLFDLIVKAQLSQVKKAVDMGKKKNAEIVKPTAGEVNQHG